MWCSHSTQTVTVHVSKCWVWYDLWLRCSIWKLGRCVWIRCPATGRFSLCLAPAPLQVSRSGMCCLIIIIIQVVRQVVRSDYPKTTAPYLAVAWILQYCSGQHRHDRSYSSSTFQGFCIIWKSAMQCCLARKRCELYWSSQTWYFDKRGDRQITILVIDWHEWSMKW